MWSRVLDKVMCEVYWVDHFAGTDERFVPLLRSKTEGWKLVTGRQGETDDNENRRTSRKVARAVAI